MTAEEGLTGVIAEEGLRGLDGGGSLPNAYPNAPAAGDHEIVATDAITRATIVLA